MKRIHFRIYDELFGQINESINRWGFSSQAEFFRYLAMEFIRNEKKLLTSDEVLKDHTKAINSIKKSQRKTFLDPTD